MAIWIGNREPVTKWDKVKRWLVSGSFLAFFVWVGFAVQIYSQDSRSHTIKVRYPFLFGFERITYRTPEFDAQKADWGDISTAAVVADGQVIFIQRNDSIYALKIWNQTLEPEQAEYEYLKVGDSSPIVKSVAKRFITFPGFKVDWSGKQKGEGFIYLDDRFIRGLKSHFEMGTPFCNGELETYRNAVPANVHFESLPWKMAEAAKNGF